VSSPGGAGALAYLDSSALVKLVVLEPETGALRRELQHWPQRVSSLLAAVELSRVALRLGHLTIPTVTHVLAGLRVLSIDQIAQTAAQIGSPRLRSLDAIHLATAQSLGTQLGVLITYDQRMLAEARALQLPYAAPR
jgi:predicted nucleic acid-binding protein